jgi:NAD-dependent deacetylase sirtuin 4
MKFNTRRSVILEGAGLSTESGIPDYRSAGTGLYARTNHRPMKHQEFVSSESARKRYWARNYFGWTYFSSRSPNIGHKILQEWESNNLISCLVTQNVDGLHRKAGSRKLVELHGSAYTVNCLECGGQCDRIEFQRRLDQENHGFIKKVPSSDDVMQIRPDGDIYLDAVRQI